MTHDVLHVLDHSGTTDDNPAPAGVTDRHATTPQGREQPARDRDRDDPTCTLTVTLRDSGGALGRIAATLSSTPVLALSYAVTDTARATAEIRVPQAHSVRARNKLNRMVDALTVT
ncbi:hypothetical protein [Streptomyces pristinaespiralis]|uniref:hypothetical protein n=1 Tax=Streptomyces pristinaespiralis TaxID=38300 RepID=UPI0033D72C7D